MNEQPISGDPNWRPGMCVVRFLDGRQAGTTTLVAAPLREGQFRFDGTELTTDRRGRTYYLKPVPDERWTHGEIPEWTAALDDDTYA